MDDLTHLACTSAAFAGLSAEILSLGKALRFRAHGASMQPLVKDGDCLLVSPAEAGSIRVGDIVLCSSEPGRVVVHRVVRRQSGPKGCHFLVQGDQARQADGWIQAAQLYGQVTSLERDGVEIDLQRPRLRALGWLAVVKSRARFARSRLTRWIGNCLYRLGFRHGRI